MKNFILCFIVFLCPHLLHAQITPAWTRKLAPARWAEISRLSSSQVAKKQLYFLPLEKSLPATLRVKTTPENLIKHKVFYSGLFSHREKEILLEPVYPKATLGKVAYVHDKHALYFEKMSVWDGAYINVTAFARHQDILREILGTLQTYYPQQVPQEFISKVFSKEEIARLNKAPAQPAAYVLTPAQLQEFAALPSLQAQRDWTQYNLAREQELSHDLLLKDAAKLSAEQFETYYNAQRRIHYFRLLARMLEQRTEKRLSAIVRYKRPLPGENIPLTDAQRGGKILLKEGESSELYKEFEQNYAPYAAAEALNAPYEVALQYGANAPELLGLEEGLRLRRLEPQDCLDEVLPQIARLETQIQALHSSGQTDPAFYVTYYRLYSQLQIYKTLAARATFESHMQDLLP